LLAEKIPLTTAVFSKKKKTGGRRTISRSLVNWKGRLAKNGDTREDRQKHLEGVQATDAYLKKRWVVLGKKVGWTAKGPKAEGQARLPK